MCVLLRQVNGGGGGAKARPRRDAGGYRCQAKDHRRPGKKAGEL